MLVVFLAVLGGFVFGCAIALDDEWFVGLGMGLLISAALVAFLL